MPDSASLYRRLNESLNWYCEGQGIEASSARQESIISRGKNIKKAKR